MPDIADTAWSERDDLNTESVPAGWPSGAMPAYVDQSGRMMMGALKRSWNKANPIYLTTGTGDNYVVQTEGSSTQTNLYEIIRVRIDRSNTTATPTLQFGNTNIRTIVKAGTSGYVALSPGDIQAGADHQFWCNGAFYILSNPSLTNGAGFQPHSTNLDAWSLVNPSGYLTSAQISAAFQPLSSSLTSWAAITRATGYDTFAANPTSANLRALVTDEAGTGALLFQNGALGTPASGTATNLIGLPLGTGVTGTLLAAQFPALAGDVTTTAGSLTTAIGANKVTNSLLAQATANTLKGNNTGSTANVADLTISQVVSLLNALTTNGLAQQITGGARITPFSNGTVTSGTLTPDPGNGPMQYYTNNGAHTLAPGTNKGQYTLEITNGASAGTITTTGFSSVKGDAFTTTNAAVFTCSVIIGQSKSTLIVVAN